MINIKIAVIILTFKILTEVIFCDLHPICGGDNKGFIRRYAKCLQKLKVI